MYIFEALQSSPWLGQQERTAIVREAANPAPKNELNVLAESFDRKVFRLRVEPVWFFRAHSVEIVGILSIGKLPTAFESPLEAGKMECAICRTGKEILWMTQKI